MFAVPVLLVLLFNALLLILANISSRHESSAKDTLFLSVVFFGSGMPALIYQVVWQRVLFSIYGVNAQSVAVVVTAFMLGLGIGSLLGGKLSQRYPRHGILIFGLAELGVAVFGLFSLQIFHFVSTHTAGANLPSVILYSLALLLIPTTLMGATLPLLVEYLVERSKRVGTSVSTLYFVNTFGSATACYLCGTYLMKNFGQSGSVMLAALMNALVGASAYLYARGAAGAPEKAEAESVEGESIHPPISLPTAMLLAAFAGFIALGFEIAWFRVFAIASSDRAPAFALMLSTFLAGIAAGSFLSEKLVERNQTEMGMKLLGVVLILAGAISVYLPPLVASLMAHKIPFLQGVPVFFVTAALIGSVLPLLCQMAVSPDEQAGRGVSLVYVANILGSAAGSLGIGFVLMHRYGLHQVVTGLSFLAVVLGAVVLIFLQGKRVKPAIWSVALVVASLVAVQMSAGSYSLLYERLVFGNRPEARTPFAQIVENRNGVIGVTQDGAVFGGGVYDGYFNVDPMHDLNLVARIYAVSAFSQNPKRVLVIGLASGSWGQILANHPQVETLDAVEINPGYLQLIPKYGMVRSFLKNPKVRIYVDDGRRWLLAHPQAKYDLIVANTTFNWRDHACALLSVEYLQLIRAHLNPGGVYYFNSTESDEAIATSLKVFPHAFRVINFVAVSDSPIPYDKERWLAMLRQYKIDGKTVFDPLDPAAQQVLLVYSALGDSLHAPPRFLGMEGEESMRSRLGRIRVITDDNMGTEWSATVEIPWH